MTQPPSHLRAILLALTGFTCWTIGDSILKLASATDTPKYEIMGLGAIGGMAVILIVTALRGKMKKLRPRRIDRLAALGILYLANYILSLQALPLLPLANYYTVIFLAPAVVTLLAGYLLKEQLSWKHGVAIALGFVGVIIAVNPAAFFSDHSHWASYGIVFIVMLIFAVQMLSLRILGNHESRECTTFYPRVVALLGALAAMAIWGARLPSATVLLDTLLSGGIGGMGWLCLAQSYKLAPASTVAPAHYSQIISGAFFGYLIWHDVPNIHTIIGASIIIASGVYMVTHIRKSGKIARTLAENP